MSNRITEKLCILFDIIELIDDKDRISKQFNPGAHDLNSELLAERMRSKLYFEMHLFSNLFPQFTLYRNPES